ncbi:MAG: hypothetical protein ACR2QK_13715 [Acidimicrobiales bacterium]
MKTTTISAVISVAALAGGLLVSASAPAAVTTAAAPRSDFWSQVIRDDLDRWPSDAPSNSGHTVEEECGEDGWQDASGSLKVSQTGTGSRVTVTIRKAKPDTLFTVWVRLRGDGPDGDLIGPNPMSGGGATALVAGRELDTALLQSPPFEGTTDPGNGFTTDRRGNARWTIDLDYPIVGGAYPFRRAGVEAVQQLADTGSSGPLVRVPAPIVDPRDPAVSGPFLIRIVSHCQDGVAHGLSPAARETWFQYP